MRKALLLFVFLFGSARSQADVNEAESNQAVEIGEIIEHVNVFEESDRAVSLEGSDTKEATEIKMPFGDRTESVAESFIQSDLIREPVLTTVSKETTHSSRISTPATIPISNPITTTHSTSHSTTSVPSSTSPTLSSNSAKVTPQKILKERFNFASFDCGAQIQSTNPGQKSSTSLLVEDMDKYMINKCSLDKFVIVELCDTIIIDTIHLANFEFFSSMFRNVSIYGVSSYPPSVVHDWVLITEIDAKNQRDVQVI